MDIICVFLHASLKYFLIYCFYKKLFYAVSDVSSVLSSTQCLFQSFSYFPHVYFIYIIAYQINFADVHKCLCCTVIFPFFPDSLRFILITCSEMIEDKTSARFIPVKLEVQHLVEVKICKNY